MKKICIGIFLVPAFIVFAAGNTETHISQEDRFSIGIFVPGIVDGSPSYELMVKGLQQTVSETNALLTIIEGGFNQADWEEGMIAMAAANRYDLIITANPGMPAIVEKAAELSASPTGAEPKFIVIDGYLSGNPRVHAVEFNQREQAFLAGYFAGLVTTAKMQNSNPLLSIGLLAGQEYPVMNEQILPSYKAGAQRINAEIDVDFRVLGNWFDAGKAQELVSDMFHHGADIVLSIAGGGNQGAITAAREQQGYIIWYDDSGYSAAPDVIIGSAFTRIDKIAYQTSLAAVNGTLEYGITKTVGITDDAVGFDTEHPIFQDTLPQNIQEAMRNILQRMKNGEIQVKQ